MPIYEYKCRKCGAKFQQFRSMNDSDSEIYCPQCGTEHPQRVFSVFSSAFSDTPSSDRCLPGTST